MRSNTPTPFLYQDHVVQRRWPDFKLAALFLELRNIYQAIIQGQTDEVDTPSALIQTSFEMVCRGIEESLGDESEPGSGRWKNLAPEWFALRSLALEVKKSYGHDWLQSVASLLGMLMHLSCGKQKVPQLVNLRRPRKLFSTYPNSPAVAKLATDSVMSRLFHQPIPLVCRRMIDAERYAEHSLNFRVLDPSMESGQLLLEAAMFCVRRVHSVHPAASKTACRLRQAILKKLCADCLWGVDTNALAARSVALIFSLLGAEYEIERLLPKHLLTIDSLLDFDQIELSRFDGIINNPPWGYVRETAKKNQLRKKFLTIENRVDTYVAFSEFCVRKLRPDGVFSLILPSQVIATRYSARLRSFFLSEAKICQMILLPPSAFADATVRAIMISGQKKTLPISGSCHVTVYPLGRKGGTIDPVRSFKLPIAELNRLGKGSWLSLIMTDDNFGFKGQTIKLGQVAAISNGIQVYKKNCGYPPQTSAVVRKRPFTMSENVKGTVPVVRARDIHSFRVGEAQEFIKFGKWLAYVGKHATFRHTTRIFMREFCRRDGRLTAAASKDGLVPLAGVLTLIPYSIDLSVLLGILNSIMAARYARQHAAQLFTTADFPKITVGELQQMPIPLAAIGPSYRAAINLAAPTKRETQLRKRLMALVGKLSDSASLDNGVAEKFQREVDDVVSEMYELPQGHGIA